MSESPAVQADIDVATSTDPTFEMFGRSWQVKRRPNPLLLAEVSRAVTGARFEDFGSLVDLFEQILGSEQYREFRAAYVDSEFGDGFEGLVEVMNTLIEAASARPTK